MFMKRQSKLSSVINIITVPAELHLSYLKNDFFKCKLHWVACKVMETRRGSCKLCWRPNVVYISINIRKIKFIAYICIRFNQKLDEKSYIRAKIEAVNIYTQYFCNCGTSPTSNKIVESHGFFLTSLTSRCSVLLFKK